MNVTRSNHNAFILNKHLFLVFGRFNDMVFHSYWGEYFNLQNKSSNFVDIEVHNKVDKMNDNNFENAMMFEATKEEQRKCQNLGYSKMYFFGGRQADDRRGQPSQSPLYELRIIWSSQHGIEP